MVIVEAETLAVKMVIETGKEAIEILPNVHLWGYMFLFAGCIHLLVAMLFFAMDRDNPFTKWWNK